MERLLMNVICWWFNFTYCNGGRVEYCILKGKLGIFSIL